MMYYVYVLCRPDGRPFYVGKGQGKRIYDHEREARSGHACHKCRIIRKIWRNGGEVQRYTVFTTDDEQEAFAYEIELIALYGRKTLANYTDGGDGASGAVVSTATRAKRGKALRARLRTPDAMRRRRQVSKEVANRDEVKAALSARMVKDWADPEKRAARTATITEVKRRPEQKEKIGKILREGATPERRARQAETSRANWNNPEYRDKVIAAVNEAMSTPEYRAQRSALTKSQWDDPEIRARRMVGIQAYAATPEAEAQRRAARELAHSPEGRRAQSEASKEVWSRPGFREAQVAVIKAVNGTPEARQRSSEASKARWADPEYRAKTLAARDKGRPKTCTIEGCDAKVFGHGLCSRHYQQARRQKKNLAMQDTPDTPELVNVEVEAVRCSVSSQVDQTGDDTEAEQDYCQTSIDLLLLD